MGGFEEVRLARRMEAACEARRSDERVATAAQVVDAVSPGISAEDRRRLALIVRKKRVEQWFADRMGMGVAAWRRVERSWRDTGVAYKPSICAGGMVLEYRYNGGRLD